MTDGLPLPVDLTGMLRRLEDAYIEAALTEADGCRAEAARLLGLHRTTLVEKLRRKARRNAEGSNLNALEHPRG